MKKVITLILALTMVFSLAACGNAAGNNEGGSASGDDTSQSQPPETDKTEFEPVPLGDFSAQDFDGNAVTKDVFADYDLTMVNLWTTTCGYCIEEMPVLNELRKEFQDKGVRFNIISVCMDIGSTEEINDANLKKAKEIIENSRYLVCLLGMRVSSQCGCTNWRSDQDAYDIETRYGCSPEEMFSAEFYNTRVTQFYDFYKREILSKRGRINEGMKTLKRLEDRGILQARVRGFLKEVDRT